jgi:hypothetical protein
MAENGKKKFWEINAKIIKLLDRAKKKFAKN